MFSEPSKSASKQRSIGSRHANCPRATGVEAKQCKDEVRDLKIWPQGHLRYFAATIRHTLRRGGSGGGISLGV